jgi:hypothetical protein
MPYPTVSPDFMAKYDHATPSGFANDACKLSRLANIGIDCRRTPGEPIDLDLLTDRTYTFLCETSDDGWLIGGGDTTKLKRPERRVFRQDEEHRHRFGISNIRKELCSTTAVWISSQTARKFSSTIP